MLFAAALTLAANVAGPSPQTALDAFLTVCAKSPTMQVMEASARSQDWVRETYPADIRAGFLVELLRQSTGGASVDYAEVYSKPLAEGQGYLIVSRRELLFGSKLPVAQSCQLSVFDFKGAPPKDALAAALGVQPTEPWSDEQGNQVLDWYPLKRFPNAHFQMSRAVSKTSLAGPADLAGLSISVEYSENRQ